MLPVHLSKTTYPLTRQASSHEKVGAAAHGAWADRTDVVESQCISIMSAADIKRQEAIAEVGVSEAAYLHDVHVLRTLLIDPLYLVSRYRI